MVAWRHDFHAHPELGFEESRTAGRVAALLDSFGLKVHRGLGGTGVVGVLQKGTGTRSIGIRADLDALPVTETNAFPYASKHSGAMHACGHDGHTAMLLGAVNYLVENGDFDGTAHFIFQPNEEHGLGASAMIRDGLFERCGIDEIFALHNIPGMAVGTFATRAGPITASESLFEIDIHARGGHAALPHMGVDAILVGAQIIQALQSIVARKLNPALNGVVSVTEFHSDGKRNILPGRATLRGDARALTADTNAVIEACMRQIVEGICSAHGVNADIRYETVFPAVINAPEQARAAARAAAALAGRECVDGSCEAKLFADDFAHLAAACPGCYVLMGNGTEGCNAQPLHGAGYDFNDAALVPGSSFWARLVEQQLAT